MGTKTENALLPPESARAIYSAIEMASEANSKLIEQQNRRLEDQNRVLDKIVTGIEQLKDKLNDGAVRFEHHSGEIRRINGEVARISTTLGDVESDVQRISAKVGPTTPFPPRRYPPARDTTALVPKNAALKRRDEEDDAIITGRVKWAKVFNVVIITFLSVGVTLFATWLFSRLGLTTPESAPKEAGMKPDDKPKLRVEPPSATDIQDFRP